MTLEKEAFRPTQRRTLYKRWHRIFGLALALPLLVWVATGLLFHWKPGWRAAYAPLVLPVRPIAAVGESIGAATGEGWLETRRLATALGEHLLVRSEKGWQHLDARTGALFPEPDDATLTKFIDQALATDKERYGTISRRDGDDWITSTAVRVHLDWTTLRLSQEGSDTRLIDRLYKIHYLQWTGIEAIDRPFALLGLVGLVLLAGAGLRLARRG